MSTQHYPLRFSALKLFLSYLKEKGRTSLETITREDISGFIEHEQDRGMQPKTVYSRLRWIYAFVSYLVDREVAHPGLLKRKMRVKVPEALPRAMDPEDVLRWIRFSWTRYWEIISGPGGPEDGKKAGW